MSESVDVLSMAAPLINSLLTLIAGGYVLFRHSRNKLRQPLYWGFGLIFLGFTYIFEFSYEPVLIGRSFITYSLEETCLSISVVPLYYGCATTLTKSKLRSASLA